MDDPEIDAVVIACAGRTFFAGADISEFQKPFRPPGLKDIFAMIDASKKLVLAAIHGTALGGGFELALSCHNRIATSSAKVGLPEVALGLLPGAGGTQRTPRLAGVSAALDLIMSGKPLDAATAKARGLIDEIAAEGSLQDAAVRYARHFVDRAVPLRRVRDMPLDVRGEEARQLFADFRRKNARLFRGFKAPENIVKALEAAVELPFDAGLAREAELCAELMKSRESEAQRHIFFSERAASKIPGLAPDLKPMPIESVAIVGAGTMGTGIAIAFLNAKVPVTLVDLDGRAVERASAKIAKTIHSMVDKGLIDSDTAKSRISRLRTETDIQSIRTADLVIEAVFERLDLKRSVFTQIDAVAKMGAILATNTSFLDVDAIAAATSRPQDVIGLHFFAPANIMRLLEVVRGEKTSDRVLVSGMHLGRRLNKVAVVSRVCEGFIANRVMAPRSVAANRLILEGAMPWDVDQALVNFGFPMGVFAMTDLVGVNVIGWDPENSKSRTVQEILCEMGRWGQKRGAGYYDYDEKVGRMPSPVVEGLIREFAAKNDVAQKNYSERNIIEQLLDPVVNEGARLIEEGVALRASDIDIAMVSGYAWPPYTGGPMFWADTQGLGTILERLKARRDAGESIWISSMLETMAAEGRKFY
jgi:3-hydroxyacyl-CoA dehydrogenase